MPVTIRDDRITGQVHLDSYADAGVIVALGLVNEVRAAGTAGPGSTPTAGHDAGLDAEPPLPAIARALASDPASLALLTDRDVAGFVALAEAVGAIVRQLASGELDAAAASLNGLLARYPAHPHLAKEHGSWRLHHHPADVALVPMWSAICAEALARQLGAGHGHRFGLCAAPGCGRAYFDGSRNASRRFCSTTCQNRVKATAFRRRRGAPAAPAR